tara:strand:+ start:1105 stop:1257 length:153 start_codon:yes stop_codon:yes gene_type:complete
MSIATLSAAKSDCINLIFRFRISIAITFLSKLSHTLSLTGGILKQLKWGK